MASISTPAASWPSRDHLSCNPKGNEKAGSLLPQFPNCCLSTAWNPIAKATAFLKTHSHLNLSTAKRDRISDFHYCFLASVCLWTCFKASLWVGEEKGSGDRSLYTHSWPLSPSLFLAIHFPCDFAAYASRGRDTLVLLYPGSRNNWFGKFVPGTRNRGHTVQLLFAVVTKAWGTHSWVFSFPF